MISTFDTDLPLYLAEYEIGASSYTDQVNHIKQRTKEKEVAKATENKCQSEQQQDTYDEHTNKEEQQANVESKEIGAPDKQKYELKSNKICISLLDSNFNLELYAKHIEDMVNDVAEAERLVQDVTELSSMDKKQKK